jgi:ADP-L-glycero-D-manno-heptose 6-epimerase
MELHEDKLIIVTGGAGFIGSCVIRHLNNQGINNILVVDDLGNDLRWKNLLGKKFVNIISKHNIFDWLKTNQNEVEAIIHLGACSDTLETDAEYLLDNNYRFSVKLAEYALKNDYRFIYASSAATYGDGNQGFDDDHESLEKLQPLNMYGYSKHLFDLWCKQQDVLDQFVGLKYFNVFGPNEYHKGRMASAIGFLLKQAQDKSLVRLFKSSDPEKYPHGDQCRDFIYVKDVVRMTCSFLKTSDAGIYNIGRGVPATWNELAAAVFESLNKKTKIDYFDMPEDLSSQYQNYTCANMAKFYSLETQKGQEKLMTTIPEAVREYVQEFLIQEARW